MGEWWAGVDPKGVKDDGAGDIIVVRASTGSSGLGVGRVQGMDSKYGCDWLDGTKSSSMDSSSTSPCADISSISISGGGGRENDRLEARHR